jgi:hypothetical protein
VLPTGAAEQRVVGFSWSELSPAWQPVP